MIPRRPIAINISVALGLILMAWGCSGSDPVAAESQITPRVVSLTPAITALIRGMGEGDHLVGVTSHCDAPGVPQVGDMRPHVERVLAAVPDLVVAAAYPFNRESIAGLQASGLHVLSFPLDSLAELASATQALGARLGAAPSAQAMNDRLDRALGAARRAATSWADRRPQALVVFDVTEGMVFTTGGGDHIAELLAAVGVDNVARGGPLTTRLSLERVIALRPDLIIHVTASPDFPDDATAQAWWSRVQHIPAVSRGTVRVWPDDHLATVGPHLAETLDRLSAWVTAHVARMAREVSP